MSLRPEKETTHISRPTHKKWLPLIALGVLLLALAFWRLRAGGGGGKTEGKAERGPEIPVVQTVPVSTGNVVSTLAVTGSLRSNQNLNLSSKIQGRIARVFVNEGQRISRGQLLIALETEDLVAQVEGARANLMSAQVRRLQAATGLPGRVQGILTAIQQAEANLATSQARYRQALLNEPVRVQQVETGLQTAEANYASAQARLRQAQLSEPARIQTAQAQVATAKETVKTAQARLNQARTTARQTEQQVNAEISGAQSLVESRRAALAEVRRGSRAQEIAAAESQVRIAEAQLRDAETELNRARILFEGGAAPRASLDTAQTQAEIARAQLESARQNLSLVREGSTNEQIRQAEEAVAQAQSQLLQAQAGRARIPVAQGEVTAALAALSQAQENVRTAESNLSQIPITRQETRVAREAVGQALAALEQARADRNQIPITRQETRVAREAVEQARATLAGARANRSQIPVARQDVLAADAGVQQARAQLEQAQINLNNARIYSPVSGVVNTKLADVGEAVGPSTPLLNLVALDSVYFEAQVSENNVPRIRVGQPVQVNVPAVQQRPLSGTVTELIPVANAQSRQFRLRVTIPDPTGRLTPGAFARGTVTTRAIYNTLSVPSDALVREDGRTFLFIATGDGKEKVVDRRGVTIGLEAGGRAQLLGGAQKGERAIIGNKELSDEDKVRIAQSA